MARRLIGEQTRRASQVYLADERCRAWQAGGVALERVMIAGRSKTLEARAREGLPHRLKKRRVSA